METIQSMAIQGQISGDCPICVRVDVSDASEEQRKTTIEKLTRLSERAQLNGSLFCWMRPSNLIEASTLPGVESIDKDDYFECSQITR